MTTTIEEFQKNPGPFIEKVQQGAELLLTSGHLPSVKLTVVPQDNATGSSSVQRTRTIRRPAGWAKGKITIVGDIEGPILTKEEWGRLWPGE
jgi:antitoxin (DNA-binding transcriptional repressor) of toxin-antitoxin stability system